MWCELEITGTKVIIAVFFHYYTVSFSGRTDERHGKLRAHALTETWTVYLLNGSEAYCHLSCIFWTEVKHIVTWVKVLSRVKMWV